MIRRARRDNLEATIERRMGPYGRWCALRYPAAAQSLHRQLQVAKLDRRGERDKRIVAQIGLVVTGRGASLEIDDAAAGGLDQAVPGGDIPFAGAAEARVDAHIAARQAPKLKRGADALGAMEAIAACELGGSGAVV